MDGRDWEGKEDHWGRTYTARVYGEDVRRVNGRADPVGNTEVITTGIEAVIRGPFVGPGERYDRDLAEFTLGVLAKL
jgi:hypothetical protein